MPGYVGVASELAQTDARYQGILENLLGRTVIAETLDHAIAMARRTGNRVRIVTLDGQVMNPGGSDRRLKRKERGRFVKGQRAQAVRAGAEDPL